MREFQGYTRARQGTRRLRWGMWLLPVVLIALIVSIEFVAGPVSIDRLTHASPPESRKVDTSSSDWVETLFGGATELTDGEPHGHHHASAGGAKDRRRQAALDTAGSPRRGRAGREGPNKRRLQLRRRRRDHRRAGKLLGRNRRPLRRS